MQKALNTTVLTLSLLLSGCTQFEKWQSQYNTRRVFDSKEVWVKQTTDKDNLGFRKINRMKPLLFKNSVIQANGIDGIGAYKKENGQLIWKLNIENGAEPSATLINDRLFIGASDGQFYAIDANTGKVLWTFPTRIETLSEPLLHEGVLYIMTGNNTLYALDASNGKQLWLYSRQDSSSLSIRGGSKPAFKQGTVYAGFSDGAVVALLASNGSVKWEKQLSKNKKFRDLDSDPLIENEFLYILGYDDQFYCLRAATGELVWKFDKGGYGSITASADRLYFAASTGEMISLEKETGKMIWTYVVKNGMPTSAALYKGLLIFGESQGSLRILDAKNGKEMSFFNPGKGILSPPSVDESTNNAYFISNEANLYSIHFGWGYPKAIPYLQ